MVIALAIIFSMGFFSCQKTPINGDLDGMWQVLEVSPEPAEVLIHERLYYSFYMHVCSLSYFGGDLTAGNLRFNGDEIYLDFPHATGYETIKKLKQYGIYSNPVVFEVIHLDKNKMILKDGEVTVVLRKF